MEPHAPQKHLLILDDNKELLDVLVLACTQKGFTVDVAQSYNEAHAKLAQRVPDAILCDIMMPDGKNGLDFAKEVRATPATEHVFVAMMTDSNSMNYIADAAMANISLYIQKAETDPFKIADQIAEKLTQ
jgi:CheY-like chemotaxis protein